MMWQGGGTVLALFATAACNSSASAQPPIGSLIDRKSHATRVEADDKLAARKTLYQFSACVLKRHRKRVNDFVETPLEDARYPRLRAALATPDCLAEGGLKMHPMNFRGAIFDALYRDRFTAAPPDVSVGTIGGLRALNPGDIAGSTQTILALAEFGACTSQRAPEDVHLLLRSQPGSSSESAAFARLSLIFPNCVPKGETFSLSKTVARGALAEGMYWLSKGTWTLPTPVTR